jgi:hypothetical protein
VEALSHARTPNVRELTNDDLGLLLSVFVLMLIAFGVDFHMSRRGAERHRVRLLVFSMASLVGELSTAVALILTWVALWSPVAWSHIDNLMVFIPGSIAVFCAVLLTVETVVSRTVTLRRSRTDAAPQRGADATPSGSSHDDQQGRS